MRMKKWSLVAQKWSVVDTLIQVLSKLHFVLSDVLSRSPFKKGLVLAAISAMLSVESLQLAVFSGITSTAENQFTQYHTYPRVVYIND